MSDTSLALQKRAFLFGREYYVLRSGRVQMILQCDQVDLGPAVTYMLFDARNPKQSARKEQALNFHAVHGITSSALEVELGGVPFHALGHRTVTRWTTTTDAVPAVEAQWWAGGIRVTELFCPADNRGYFTRTITLSGMHLVAEEHVALRFYAPGNGCSSSASALRCVNENMEFEITAPAADQAMVTVDMNARCLVLNPVAVRPGRDTSVTVQLGIYVISDNNTNPDVSGDLPIRNKWSAASRVSTSDRVLQDVFDRARYGIDGMIADDGAMNAGIFEYGAQWVRDSSNAIIGAIHAGHFELARAGLDRILSTMITTSGATMIAGGFDEPDREQFDQMGELMHVLKAYTDWTGDKSLLVQYGDRLIPMIERPLHPSFRDDSGMVHNRREFWERTLTDGYELAYQTWLIQGLRDAAELAPIFNAKEHADRWREEADKTFQAMISHPKLRLVEQGHLIKRRGVTGEVADETTSIEHHRPDAPTVTETGHRLRPDSAEALPIALGIVDARSAIARSTLNQLEQLWNTRWHDGGYDRYNTTSQPDQPGPWPFATCFIMRAQHDAGLLDRSRRSLEWLANVQGGRTGAWFEEIPSNRAMAENTGIIPWCSGEIALFVVRHVLGVRFEGGTPVIKPNLFPDSPPVEADLRFRTGRLNLKISGPGKVTTALVNGTEAAVSADGAVRLPDTFSSGTIELTASR